MDTEISNGLSEEQKSESNGKEYGEYTIDNGKEHFYCFKTSDVDYIYYNESAVKSAFDVIGKKKADFFDLVNEFNAWKKAKREEVRGLHYEGDLIADFDSRCFQAVGTAFTNAEKNINKAGEDIKRYSASPDGVFYDSPKLGPVKTCSGTPIKTCSGTPINSNPYGDGPITPAPTPPVNLEPDVPNGNGDDVPNGPKAEDIIDSAGNDKNTPDISNIGVPINPNSGTNGDNNFSSSMTGITSGSVSNADNVYEQLGDDIADSLVKNEAGSGLLGLGATTPGQLSLNEKNVKNSSSIGLAVAAAGAAVAGAAIGGGIYASKKEEAEGEEDIEELDDSPYEKLDGFSSVDLKNEILKLDEEEEF